MKRGIYAASLVFLGISLASGSGIAAETSMPKGAVPCDVPYVSGGLGIGSRQELTDASSQFTLKLAFAEKGTGAYLAGVRVAIADRKGAPVLEAISEGPWFLAKLKPGRYRVTVESGGVSQARQISVGSRGLTQHVFYWPARADAEAKPAGQ